MRLISACAGLMLLAGCATLPDDSTAERDPLERFNRGMWQVNNAIDDVTLKPVARVYRTVAPRPARRGIHRVFLNFAEPWSAINNLLQGKPGRAARNIGRFMVNSTIGVGGLADHASGLGLTPADEDLGQTFARWGIGSGPYLVLPLLGPSSLRDGIGSAAYFIADPYHVAVRQSDLGSMTRTAITAGELVDLRSELIESGADAFVETSLDPYAALRSAYLQRRKAQIRNRENDPIPDTIGEIPEDSSEAQIEPKSLEQLENGGEPGKITDSPGQ